MANPNGLRAAVLATDGFEEVELTEPVKALRDAGAQALVIAPHAGTIQAFKHMDKSITVPVDMTLDQANPENFDLLLLPGGALNADKMRMVPEVRKFVRTFMENRKPMAVICHAPWEVVSAGFAYGRTMTSYYTIQDDVRNAGANWVDTEVVVDGNLVTSRQPSDIPAFNREMLKLAEQHQSQSHAALR